MNNVVLVGRLTKDPELRTTPNGIATCNITVAINGIPSQNGDRNTDFINVVVGRRQAENVSKYCSKGSLVGINGKIHTRSYEASDGNKRFITEIVADNVTFLGSNNKGSSQYSDVMPDYNNVDQITSAPETTDLIDDPFKDFGSEVVLSDDDLPF